MGGESKYTEAARGIGKGYLSSLYAGSVGVVDDQSLAQEEQRRTRHQLTLQGNTNIIGDNSISNDDPKTKAGQEKKKKEEKDFLDIILAHSIQEQLREFDRMIDWMRLEAKRLRDEAAELRKKFADGLPRMAELSEMIEKEQRFLKEYERTKQLDRDAWIKFLRSQGKQIGDKISNHDLIDMMHQAQKDDQNEYNGIKEKEDAADQKLKQADDLDRQADELYKRRQEIEKLPPGQQAEALKALWKDVPPEVLREYKADHKDLAAEVSANKKESVSNELNQKSSSSASGDLDDDTQPSTDNTKIAASIKLPGLN